MSDSLQPHGLQRQTSLSFTIFQSLKFMPIESVMLSIHLFLCCPLILLPLIFPSIKVFSNESALCTRWPKCWSFSLSSSNEYLELISFRIDWFEPLGPNESQESSTAPQFESTNWLSGFYMIQLSHLYMTTGKTIALTLWTFVGKVMLLLK